MRHIAGALFVCVVSACSEPRSTPDADDTSNGSDTAAADAGADEGADGGPEPGCVELRFDAVPQTAAAIGTYVFVPEDATFDGDRVTALSSQTIAEFALSDSLPTQFTGLLNNRWYGMCGAMDGRFVIERIDVDGDAVRMAVDDQGTVAVELLRAGTAEVTVTGAYEAPDIVDGCAAQFAPGTSTPWTERWTVRVAEPTAIDWALPFACEQTVRGATGQVLTPASPVPVGDDGGRLGVLNALPERAIGYTARFCGDPTWRRDDTVPSGLRLPSVPGVLLLDPDVGETLEVEVVDGTGLGNIAVGFEIPGVAGGPTPVTDGATLGPGWGRTGRRIFVTATVPVGLDNVPLCTPVDPGWFTVSAGPAAQCGVEPDPCPTPGGCWLVYGQPVGESVYPRADGTCTIEVGGPTPVGGTPLSSTVTFSLVNVEGMIDF